MPRNVWILSGIALGVAIGYGVVNPVLPVFAASFGVDTFAAAAVVSAFALMRLVFAPAVGSLTGRFGHRGVLLAGVLMVAASSVGAGFARSYPELIALRGVGGIGSAMFSVSAMTVLLASADASHRGRASALYQGGFLVGAVTGPAIGGLFARISLRAPFFFYAATLVVAAVVALGLQPAPGLSLGRRRRARDLAGPSRAPAPSPSEPVDDADRSRGVDTPGGAAPDSPVGPAAGGDAGPGPSSAASAGHEGGILGGLAPSSEAVAGERGGQTPLNAAIAPEGAGASADSERPAGDGEAVGGRTASSTGPRSLREVARDRRYQAALLAALAQGWNTHGARSALVPLFVAAYLVSDAAQAAWWAGVAMSVAAAVQMAAIWPAGWVVDKWGRRGPMIAGAVLAGAAMAAIPASGTLAALTALLALYALGAALLGTAPAAAVGDAAGPGGTRAIALFSMAGDTGAVVGPLVAGWLASHLSFTAAFAAGAALWAASALVSSLMKAGRSGGPGGRAAPP